MAIRNLTDICDIQYGFAFDASGFTTAAEEGMPLVRIRDVMNGRTETYFKGSYPKEYIIHKGDFLVGMDGEFNIAPWKSDAALLNQRVCRVKSNQSGVSTKFLFWFLKKELKRIEDETPFVTVKHLSAKRLKQVQLEVPPIAEQEKIIAELDCLTGIIEKKKQQLEELDKLAQSIFYDMFGDPIAVEKGWKVKKLGDLAELQRGLTYSKGDEVPFSSKCVLRSNNIDLESHTLDLTELKYLREDFAIPEDRKVKKNSIFICMSNGSKQHVGKVAFIGEEMDYAFGGFMGLIVPKEGINPRYVFYACQSSSFRLFLSSIGNGIGITNLRFPDLATYSFHIPPLGLQCEFAQKIEAIEKQKELVKQSIVETETLFNSRMDYWFN